MEQLIKILLKDVKTLWRDPHKNKNESCRQRSSVYQYHTAKMPVGQMVIAEKTGRRENALV
jgi:hypothetical protein